MRVLGLKWDMLRTGWLVKKQSKTKAGFKNMEEHARRERQEVKRERERKKEV